MRDGIHPKYAPTTIHCACGNSWEVQSTKQNMRIDVCSKCHPFYTGEQRLMDTGGPVERFRRRMQRATQGAQAAAAQPAAAEPAE